MKKIKKNKFQLEDVDEIVTITFKLKDTTLAPAVSFTPSGDEVDVKNNKAVLPKLTKLSTIQIDYIFTGTQDGEIKTNMAGSSGGSFNSTILQPLTPGETVTTLTVFLPKAA